MTTLPSRSFFSPADAELATLVFADLLSATTMFYKLCALSLLWIVLIHAEVYKNMGQNGCIGRNGIPQTCGYLQFCSETGHLKGCRNCTEITDDWCDIGQEEYQIFTQKYPTCEIICEMKKVERLEFELSATGDCSEEDRRGDESKRDRSTGEREGGAEPPVRCGGTVGVWGGGSVCHSHPVGSEKPETTDDRHYRGHSFQTILVSLLGEAETSHPCAAE
ncbi:uncharacterized protein LOC143280065 isoform X3 [Babylonia areolata]|uniref:uncharacterized protein LOC143280065 isoform X3 n=1 Tax=Babylonia areolata TaxID=304850 RepID=UPI003FD17AE4